MNFSTFILILILIYIFNPKRIMSWIKDFKELSFTTKTIVVTLLVLIPLFIFSFYFLKPDILNYQWYVILSIAFAICIIYYILNAINIFLQTELFYDKDYNYGHIASFIQPVFELIIIIIIAYFLKWYFKTFIIVSCLLNVWRCLLFGILYLAQNRNTD